MEPTVITGTICEAVTSKELTGKALTGEAEAIASIGLIGKAETAGTKLIAYRGGNSAVTQTGIFGTGL